MPVDLLCFQVGNDSSKLSKEIDSTRDNIIVEYMGHGELGSTESWEGKTLGEETSMQEANQHPDRKTSSRASAADWSEDPGSIGDDVESASTRRSYFHHGAWSSTDRFPRAARCDELQAKWRSYLRELLMGRQ